MSPGEMAAQHESVALVETVGSILKGKGSNVWSLGPEATVYEAIAMMAEKGVGALLVVSQGQPVGIISERDYARKVILFGKSSKETLVREIMTDKVLCVRPDQTVDQCMALMTDKRVRHLPVLDHKQVMGVISIGDVVKEVISEQQFVIAQLEHYIHS